MAEVTPLARGPLTATEAVILEAIPLTTTVRQIAVVLRLDEDTVEDAIAQLCRRGLVKRTLSHVSRVTRSRRRSRRPRLTRASDTAGAPTPTLPAA
jgi:DNA-binding MarR family transcriptional regulator